VNETAEGPRYHVPGRRVCAACGRVLDYHEGSGWAHTFDPTLQDHPAVPVLDTEIPTVVEKCDFCFGDGTTWILPARDFEVGPNHGSDGDWGACDQCAELIQTNQWTRLVQRVKDSWPHQHGMPMPSGSELWLRRTYRKLRDNITGPIRRIEP